MFGSSPTSAMDRGTVAAQGAQAEELTEELLAKVVDVGGAPVVVPDRVRI